MAMKKAVVVGALGVIGRYIVERLLAAEDWTVVGLSRASCAGGAALPAHRRRPARCARCHRQARRAEGRHAHLLRRLPGGDGCGGWLCLQHRPQPRHAGQFGDRHRRRLALAGARRADHRHQVLRLASRPLQDAGARERSAPHAARLLLRPDRLADGLPEGQVVGLGGAAAADAVRLRAGHADEHPAGHRGVCLDQQGAGSAAALSGQARRVRLALPGDRVRPHGQRGAVGGHRAALRAGSLQRHQRRLFPLEEPVAEDRRRCSTCRSAIRRPSA